MAKILNLTICIMPIGDRHFAHMVRSVIGQSNV